jgi:hypothetical protein
MGAFLVELVPEAVKAILLLQAVEPWRPGGFPTIGLTPG